MWVCTTIINHCYSYCGKFRTYTALILSSYTRSICISVLIRVTFIGVCTAAGQSTCIHTCWCPQFIRSYPVMMTPMIFNQTYRHWICWITSVCTLVVPMGLLVWEFLFECNKMFYKYQPIRQMNRQELSFVLKTQKYGYNRCTGSGGVGF